jgi:Sec7-like guanine-nucleotide exchange factor
MEINMKVWFMCLMPLSTTFQLYRGSHAILLVEKTGVSAENHQPVASQ